MEKNSQIKTCQMLFMKQIAKFSSRQYFPLYGMPDIVGTGICGQYMLGGAAVPDDTTGTDICGAYCVTAMLLDGTRADICINYESFFDDDASVEESLLSDIGANFFDDDVFEDLTSIDDLYQDDVIETSGIDVADFFNDDIGAGIHENILQEVSSGVIVSPVISRSTMEQSSSKPSSKLLPPLLLSSQPRFVLGVNLQKLQPRN